MTVPIFTFKECALCGETSHQRELASTSYFGSPDLDGRLPPPARWALDMQIQTCPSCGYCAPDISKKVDKASVVVKSDSYKKQLKNPRFPKLANAFLCFSMIMEETGNFAKAGWACVYAAWACDDANNDVGARKCRERAVALLRQAKQADQRFAKRVGEEIAIMADLLRRAGRFEEALVVCDEGLKKHLGKTMRKVLMFQKELIRKGDTSCHEIEEVFEKEEHEY